MGNCSLIAFLLLLAIVLPTATRAENVIFIHADGASQEHFTATRLFFYGADGMLNWDKLPNVAVTKNHIADRLSPDSVSAAVAHAAGIKTNRGYYGLDVNKRPIYTVMEEARDTGRVVGLINTGSITEPGTGVFVASVNSRRNREEIASQILRAGVEVILGGGEQWFIPKGVKGRHGMGRRDDDRNLIEEAIALGYTIVYDTNELSSLSSEAKKTLGLFAAGSIYSVFPAKGYKENAPSLAQMVAFALDVVSEQSDKGQTNAGFLLVVEEEGVDDFSSFNNEKLMMVATKRADDAIGVALKHVIDNPETLLITTADSNAGGPQISKSKVGFRNLSTPDGMEFFIEWSGIGKDYGSGTITRASGKYSELIRGTIDNTYINTIIRKALKLDKNQPNSKPLGSDSIDKSKSKP